jgi:hypothetical protein
VKPSRVLPLLLAVPLLVGAKDPRGDVSDCATGRPASGPDLVAVTGIGTELGTVAVWRLTFDRPITVPSDLRIDVLVRDPRLAPEIVGGERGMNRIVRWDATSRDRTIQIIWLPHDGATSFNAPTIRGRTIELVAPGRLLLGESVNGVESVRRARWSVVVRAGDACDRLGSGVPTERLAMGPNPSPSPLPSASPAPSAAQRRPSSFRAPWLLLGIGLVAVGFWLLRRRPVNVGSSSARSGTKLPNGHG